MGNALGNLLRVVWPPLLNEMAPSISILGVRSPRLLGSHVSLEFRTRSGISNYCWKTGGGPLIRFHFRLTFTSTRLAILMKGILLFIP